MVTGVDDGEGGEDGDDGDGRWVVGQVWVY